MRKRDTTPTYDEADFGIRLLVDELRNGRPAASARLVAYFEFGGGSRKTYNNRRGTMSGFLKFALQREWITENPLAKIPAHRIRRRRSGDPGPDDDDLGVPGELVAEDPADACPVHDRGTRSPSRTGASGGRAVGTVSVPATQANAWRQDFPWHGPVSAPVRRLTSSGSV